MKSQQNAPLAQGDASSTSQAQSKFQIAAFYHFQSVPLDQLQALATSLEALGAEMGLRGLIIFASEGINGTICGLSRDIVTAYLKRTSEILDMPPLGAKWSESYEWPFRKFRVRLRPEIVTLGKPEVQPLPPQSETHISPSEWNRMMTEEDVVVLDTRNWYETRIGKFKGAIDPKLDEFHHFGDYLKQEQIAKNQKVLIYCTGGIRCEKAIVEMHEHGYEKVYQLDGGILNYLDQYPNQQFEGECFVFDTRVAVDQSLAPSTRFKLCPHCGQPADEEVICVRCDNHTAICPTCIVDPHKKTCSKNCANHHRLAPHKKGRPQKQTYRSAYKS